MNQEQQEIFQAFRASVRPQLELFRKLEEEMRAAVNQLTSLAEGADQHEYIAASKHCRLLDYQMAALKNDVFIETQVLLTTIAERDNPTQLKGGDAN